MHDFAESCKMLQNVSEENRLFQVEISFGTSESTFSLLWSFFGVTGNNDSLWLKKMKKKWFFRFKWIFKKLQVLMLLPIHYRIFPKCLFRRSIIAQINHLLLFLVGAFLVKSARLLQWLSFFSSDYNLTLIGPLFLQSKLLKLLP